MIRLTAALVAGVGFVLLVLSAYVSYQFGSMLGAGHGEGVVLGSIGVALVLGKSIAPLVVRAAYAARAWPLLAAAVVALVALTASSLAASYGLTAAMRQHAADTAAVITPHRPPAVVRPLLEQERDRKARAALQAELAAGLAAEKAAPSAAAQTVSLAAVLGISTGTTRSGLTMLFAVAIELAELICWVGAATLWSLHKPAPPPQPPPPLPPAPEVHAQPPAPRPRASYTRFDLDTWITDYLDGRDGVSAAEAYDAYCAVRKASRRKVVQQLEFRRALERVARKDTAGNRVVYRVA
jgi:hypothetical protein